MKKILLIIFLNVFIFAMNLFNLGFTKNYFQIYKDKPVSITSINKVNFKNIIYTNPEKNFKIKINQNLKIFSIEQLNKILLKNGYPFVLKVEKETNNNIYVKIVPADILNKYDVKGIRLNKKYHVKQIINKLNNQYYTQILYQGEDFEVPRNPNIVIKNIQELKKYLDATNNKSIMFVSSTDINNDTIPEFIKYKEIINKQQSGITPLDAIIKHLEYAKSLANKINNSNFQKELFIQDMQDTINQLKALKENK